MSTLTNLAQPLIDEPLVPRPDRATLTRRVQRRNRQRLFQFSGVLAVAVATVLAVTQLGPVSAPTSRRHVRLAAFFEAGVELSNSTLATVGLPNSVTVPDRVTPTLATVSTNDTVSFVGSTYCPYCAFARWSLLVALSRFGTFTNLDSAVRSSSNDVFPGLRSWSYAHAQYRSRYFTFVATEFGGHASAVTHGPSLRAMSRAQRVAFTHFDPQGEQPYVNVGNRYVVLGASASPSVLEGLSMDQISAALSDPTSSVAVAVDGTANYLIGAMCHMISGASPAICSSPTTVAAQRAERSSATPIGVSRDDASPAQPPTDSSRTRWLTWSAAMHAYLLASAADVRYGTGSCQVRTVSVSSTSYHHTTLGVPPGVPVWALTVVGTCRSHS